MSSNQILPQPWKLKLQQDPKGSGLWLSIFLLQCYTSIQIPMTEIIWSGDNWTIEQSNTSHGPWVMSKSGKETSAECDCLFDLLILKTNLGKLSTCFHKSLNLKENSFEYDKLMLLLKTGNSGQFVDIRYCRAFGFLPAGASCRYCWHIVGKAGDVPRDGGFANIADMLTDSQSVLRICPQKLKADKFFTTQQLRTNQFEPWKIQGHVWNYQYSEEQSFHVIFNFCQLIKFKIYTLFNLVSIPYALPISSPGQDWNMNMDCNMQEIRYKSGKWIVYPSKYS